jgi:YidC/Oxa1 family membrane protein insertase
MESTMAMQAVAPRVKELQARYANEPETLQLETARLYKSAGINPLAGCLPTLATIPVFIGLYRALTKAADDGLLTSGFFWIPSLGGPTSMTERAAVRMRVRVDSAKTERYCSAHDIYLHRG